MNLKPFSTWSQPSSQLFPSFFQHKLFVQQGPFLSVYLQVNVLNSSVTIQSFSADSKRSNAHSGGAIGPESCPLKFTSHHNAGLGSRLLLYVLQRWKQILLHHPTSLETRMQGWTSLEGLWARKWYRDNNLLLTTGFGCCQSSRCSAYPHGYLSGLPYFLEPIPLTTETYSGSSKSSH